MRNTLLRSTSCFELAGALSLAAALLLGAEQASAARFTLASPLPFSFNGVTGTVLPVSDADAMGTPECLGTTCPFDDGADLFFFRVVLDAGSASLHQIQASVSAPPFGPAGYLPSSDPSEPIPEAGSQSGSHRFVGANALEAGERTPVLIRSASFPVLRTSLNSGLPASVTGFAASAPFDGVLLGRPAFAGLDPAPSVSLEQLGMLFNRPVYATSPPDDPRVFVVTQVGEIRIIQPGALLTGPHPVFLSVPATFNFASDPFDERGLLGLAFAPDYATSGAFYVHYVAADPDAPSGPGRITVARHTVSDNPNLANQAGTVLLSIPKPGPPAGDPSAFEAYHNGGQLAFGPDGLLYVGIGDGGGWQGFDPWNCAQNPASPLGKILRVDPAALTASPVIVAASAQCPTISLPAPPGLTIWASGLRNPWRFGFDRESGDLWVGDVGEALREEIDFVQAAGLADLRPNFGWDVQEGKLCNATSPAPAPACGSPILAGPIYEYEHVPQAGCNGSVIGGYMSRASVPALRGKYVFGDFCRVLLRTLESAGPGNVVVQDLPPEAQAIEVLSSLGEDGAGELLAVDYTGSVYRLVPEPDASALGLGALAALFAARRRARHGAGHGEKEQALRHVR